MKSLLFFLIFSVNLFTLQAQIVLPIESAQDDQMNEYGLDLQTIRLKNGLTVFLNPDPNLTDVLGVVVVKGGSNHDAKDAEGTSHYFEHMMFKGSQKLGTVDYKSEKVYLDSIRAAYDLLAFSKGDEKFRNGILKNIDRLSQEAAQYAIPNEFNKVLSGIGGTKINAYTTYENIVYHNHFPAQSMEQWVKLQVDRFANPVFRLFQSELETVYEEKNRSMDNSFRGIYQELYKNFYPNSVYGKQTVLGSVESLKTPSISKMETYFKEYYVANNMALILVGNFDTERVKQMLDNTFGTWRDGQFIKVAKAQEPGFEGRVVVSKKLSPVPLGILGFRTVKKGDPDELVLEVINQLLTNDESTGLLDELTLKNELMYVTSISDMHYDIGASFIAFVPKPFIQSLKSGEKKVLAQIEKLKSGDFDESLLKAIVTKKHKEFIMGLESSDFRSQLIIDAFMSDRSVNELIAMRDKINDIDKKKVQEISKKYFGPNYMAFLSKTGFPNKTKLDKPNISPIKPVNSKLTSEFASRILEMPTGIVEPRYIDFNRDVLYSEFFSNLHFFYGRNPMNNIYSIEFRIGVGNYSKPELTVVADYLNLAGTRKEPFTKFRTRLQSDGASIHCFVDKSYFHITMTGFDYSLEHDLDALKQLLNHTEINETVLKKVVKDYSMEYKLLKHDIGLQSKVLHKYAVYGDKSPYLHKLSMPEMKKLKTDDIMSAIQGLLRYETDIHYVGTKSEANAKKIIEYLGLFKLGLIHSQSPVYLAMPTLSQNEIYFMNNKKAVQSHIRITIPSKTAFEDERNYIRAFNKYFGLGMSSVLFREVREYRSLAYGVYAYVSVPQDFSNPVSLNGVLTTQGDKTNDAIKVFTNLIDSMPLEPERIGDLKQALTLSFNSQIPNFRDQTFAVAYWMKQAYKNDPRMVEYDKIASMNMEHLNRFYINFVVDRKHSMSVVGDAKRIDMEKLKKEGAFMEVKLKKIYKK